MRNDQELRDFSFWHFHRNKLAISPANSKNSGVDWDKYKNIPHNLLTTSKGGCHTKILHNYITCQTRYHNTRHYIAELVYQMPTQGTQWRSHRDFNKSTALLLRHLERKSRKIPVCSYQEVTFIFTLKQNILLQFCCFPNVNHSSFISVSFYSTVESLSLAVPAISTLTLVNQNILAL